FGDAGVLEAVHGRAGEDAVGGGHDDSAGALFEEGVGGLDDGSAGVDHIVDDDAGAALDGADDVEDLDLVGDVGVALLVDDGHGHAAEAVGPAFGDPDAAGVGGDDRHLREVQTALEVGGHEVQREQVVDRAVEAALDLRRVQVDRHEAVGASGLEQVRHQARGDRFAAAVLLVLPRVAEEGRHHRDALGGRAFQRVHHDQLLHDPLVDGGGVALYHEGVGTPHGLQ